ncbi:MAG: 30S ribosomal protein S4 [Myxococcota bacterium]
MKYNGPRVKRSRRIGVALTPKAQKTIDRKGMERGVGGRPKRISEYGLQLLEKQRLLFQYNISEKQMRRYFKAAQRQKGRTGENLVVRLERRLDAFVLRAGFAPTIYAARQLVGHGHFEVNGVRARASSQLLRPGDLVVVREKSRGKPIFDMDWNIYAPPEYIDRDVENLSAKLNRLPERSEVPIVCEEQYVVEFYSR